MKIGVIVASCVAFVIMYEVVKGYRGILLLRMVFKLEVLCY